jgi:hypothetical protein
MGCLGNSDPEAVCSGRGPELTISSFESRAWSGSSDLLVVCSGRLLQCSFASFCSRLLPSCIQAFQSLFRISREVCASFRLFVCDSWSCDWNISRALWRRIFIGSHSPPPHLSTCRQSGPSARRKVLVRGGELSCEVESSHASRLLVGDEVSCRWRCWQRSASLLALDLSLDAVNGVRRLHPNGDYLVILGALIQALVTCQ